MGAIHALRVKSPYELLKIEDIKIENKPNEHGYLYLKCLIDDSIKFMSTIDASTEDKICIYEQQEESLNRDESLNINEVNESKSKILFDGTVQNIKTSNVNGVYCLEIEALTTSFELDIKEKSRSFQNVNMTYDELIKEILKDYASHNYMQFIGEGKKIGKPIFQYKETDWNLLKRIVSELNSEIYCDIINNNNMFYFGRSEEHSYELKDDISYSAHKNLKKFYESGGYGAGFHDTDYFYYEVRKSERYETGDKIYFKQKELYVSEYSGYNDKGELIYKYKLCRKNGVWQTKLYNSLIGGASIEGKVLSVDGEKVKLHLNIDEKQDSGEASWFPYAPPTGNSMYSMPIVGTNATLYFPDESGENPSITGCIRKNGSSCAKTGNTSNRYFGTEHGSELEMTPGAINITGGSKEPLSISFDDKKGVTLTSPKKLTLNADNEIVIKTPKTVTVKGESKVSVLKSKSSNGFSIETDMHFLGSNVIKNGSCRETYAPFDDEPKAGKKPEPVKKEEKKKGFSWGRLLVAAVAVVAVAVSIATFGIGAVLVGAAVGALISVASTAIGDAISGESSSLGTYIKSALVGAVSGAIFGPFGAFESLGGMMAFGGVTGMADSLLNQAIEGEFRLGQTFFDGLIGAATGGLIHGAGKLISKVSLYLKNGIGKVLSRLSVEAKNILSKVSGKLDDVMGAFSKTSKELFYKAANKADDVLRSIKNSAQDLADRLSGKFTEVTSKIDNKINDILWSGAEKADELADKLFNNKGPQFAFAGIDDDFSQGSTFFKDNIEKIIQNRNGSINVNPGKTSTRSENSLRNKLTNKKDANGNRIYSDEQIEDIITMRNSEYELTLEDGSQIILKRHGYQKLEEGQSHHLNQNAAFEDVIPQNEAIAIKLEGNAFTDYGSSHQNSHKSLEEFWNRYRRGGEFEDLTPTVGEYNVALKESMKVAGFSENDSELIVEIARQQQELYGFTEVSEVPKIPGKINFKNNGGN